MSTPNPARKRLPVKPSVENLRKQAKRLAKLDNIQLAEAQHRLAAGYGSRNWAELMHVVETMLRGSDQLSFVQYEMEALPKAANQRNLDRVRAILASGEFTQHDLDLALARSVLAYGERGEIASLLIEHGADPDGQYGSDYGPIVFVTGECLDPDGLQFLLDHGADVSFPPIGTKYGKQCPLSYWLGTYARGNNAAKHRGIDLLLAHGAFIPPEITPPILAIHRGDAKALANLLDKDPSLIRRTFADMPYGNIALAGATLLHCAIEFDEIECIDVLLDHYADINAKADVIDGVGGQTPIYHLLNTGWASHLATLEHVIRRVGHWIDTGVRATWRTFDGPRAKAVTPLEYAEEPGDEKWRKNKDAEIGLLRSLDRRAAIGRACEHGDVAEVARLIDETPALLSGELWPPAVHVAKSLALTRLLLERGLDPNISSAPRRALDLACYHALADIAELLLAHGASATEPNKLGERPLDLLDAYEPRPVGDDATRRIRAALLRAGAADDIHSAVRAGDADRVRHMLDADPALLESQAPWPPLFSAARSGRLDVAKLLIERGAKVDGSNDKDNTPLWFACQSPANADDRLTVAMFLLESGANPRRECEDKSTPLHFAAWRGPIQMVELLIRHNAKTWQADKEGKLPIDYAKRGPAPDKEAIIHLLDRPVIDDPHFRAAVDAIHAGDLAALKQLLIDHPNLSRDRAVEPACYLPTDYFGSPKLIWFIANNPTLMKTMPRNIVDLASAIIDAGVEQSDLDYTLGLVMTSDPAIEQGLLKPLMDLLLQRGAAVTPESIHGTLGHQMIEPVRILLNQGHPLTAPVAAALGKTEELKRLLQGIDEPSLHAALSLAVINRQVEAARLCLDAGADVNAFLIVHAHSTPAHQAAVNDDVEMLRLLVERGADPAIQDTLWRGTPLGWAIHTAKLATEAFLRSIAPPRG